MSVDHFSPKTTRDSAGAERCRDNRRHSVAAREATRAASANSIGAAGSPGQDALAVPPESTLDVGYARGAFDLFHIGHLNLLRHASEHCDRLVAGVVADDVLISSKGVTPFIPERERLEVVASVRWVDEAVLDDDEDPLDTWHRIGFTTYFKGDDWNGTPRGRALEKSFGQVGVRVCYFPYTATTSSTHLRQLIEARA
jgi:glycerol-3-phosphate cytidylyltransferase